MIALLYCKLWFSPPGIWQPFSGAEPCRDAFADGTRAALQAKLDYSVLRVNRFLDVVAAAGGSGGRERAPVPWKSWTPRVNQMTLIPWKNFSCPILPHVSMHQTPGPKPAGSFQGLTGGPWLTLPILTLPLGTEPETPRPPNGHLSSPARQFPFSCLEPLARSLGKPSALLRPIQGLVPRSLARDFFFSREEGETNRHSSLRCSWFTFFRHLEGKRSRLNQRPRRNLSQPNRNSSLQAKS